MYVLRRKPGDGILIQGNIFVRLLTVEGERVTFGIEAPREIPIVRSELHPLPSPMTENVPEKGAIGPIAANETQ